MLISYHVLQENLEKKTSRKSRKYSYDLDLRTYLKFCGVLISILRLKLTW